MNIIEKSLSQIKPYKRNSKKHDQTQIDNVAESLRQYGAVQPIVVDKDNYIVIGHCRALAAKQLGWKTFPCVSVDDLTPEQVNALRIVDNKTNESAWDFDMLELELPEINLSEFSFDFEDVVSLSDEYGDEFSLPDGDKGDICQMTLTLHVKQKELIENAVSLVENYVTETFGNTNRTGNAVYEVVRQWVEQKK